MSQTEVEVEALLCENVERYSAPPQTHVKALGQFISGNPDDGAQQQVRYLVAEDLFHYLDSLQADAPQEDVVRGYTVRTTQQLVDPKEADVRRQAIAEVIARSLRKSK